MISYCATYRNINFGPTLRTMSCVAIQIYETSAGLTKQLTMPCNSIAAIESNQDATVFNVSRGRGGGCCVGRGRAISAARPSLCLLGIFED